MATSFQDQVSTLIQLAEKLSLELVYAEPGKDNGLLPVNFLLNQIEEICQAAPPPTVIAEAIVFGRKRLDHVFNTTGLFDPDSIHQLGDFANWLSTSLESCAGNQDLPALPEDWANPITVIEGLANTASAEKPGNSPAPTDTDEPLVINLRQDLDLLREFTSEAHEHLQNIELGVLVLEDKPTDTETLNSIFRAFHTFKGGSALLNLVPVKKLAHDLESLLDLARQNKLEITSEIIDLILEGGDLLKKFTDVIVAQISGEQPSDPVLISTQSLLHRVRGAIDQANQGAGSNRSGAIPQTLPAETSESSPSSAKPAKTTGNPLELEALSKSESAPAQAASVVKVATQKLDSLVDLVGEMVIAQSLVVQDSAINAVASTNLTRNLAQLRRITSDLQRIAMSLRMVPIRSTFQKMNRLVRDIAARQEKQVVLECVGEETELDRTIVEQLNDPLIHMIRNSIDHGIEKPAVRVAAGKPPQGTIQLRACHQGGNIVIEIRDDGAGLNKERILAKGIERGMIRAGEELTEEEVYNLILLPGFSTAEVVTELSGRGVGMDVVHRNIEKLRGKVEIQSRRGQGTTFTIYLPLTLAIIDGLIVRVGNHQFILPTLLVRESFRPTADMITTLQERGEMVVVRGRLSPMLRLYDFFGIEPQSNDPTQSIIVVIGAERENRCLMVDQLLGKQEVVIKGLGEAFKGNRAVAGAAILGDGRVGLILDVDFLVKLRGNALRKAA